MYCTQLDTPQIGGVVRLRTERRTSAEKGARTEPNERRARLVLLPYALGETSCARSSTTILVLGGGDGSDGDGTPDTLLRTRRQRAVL